MKIATLQIDSQIGRVQQTIAKANWFLEALGADRVDLLVLPELAFTGYNYPTLDAIRPYLEPTAAGISTQWAIETAKRLNCYVIVGYPEVSNELDEQGIALNYNSTVTVSPDGAVVATYRKSFLYYTDECWAAEGSGFYRGNIGSLGMIAHGICMDINPKEFTAPYDAFEFANHCLTEDTDLIVISTAWLTQTPEEELLKDREMPDMDTLLYWINRMLPLMARQDGKDRIVVFANRCGSEANLRTVINTRNGNVIEMKEPAVNYAGSSCVLRFNNDGVAVYGLMGSSEEKIMVLDTSTRVPIPLLRVGKTGPIPP